MMRQYAMNGLLWVTLGAAMWGTDGLLRIPLLETWTSWQIVWIEHMILCAVAIPFLWFRRSSFRGLSASDWGLLLLISWGSSALATWMFSEAFRYGHPSAVILLQKFQPLVAIGVAALLLREKLPRIFPLAAVAAMGGAYLLSFGWNAPFTSAAGNQWIGSLLALGAAVLWGAGTVFGRRLLGKLSFGELTAARFAGALPVLAIAVVLQKGTVMVPALPADLQLRMLLLALLPGCLGMVFYYYGLQRTKASYATFGELAFPASALLLNWLYMDQGIQAAQWAGLAVIWSCVVVLTLEKRGSEPEEPMLLPHKSGKVRTGAVST